MQVKKNLSIKASLMVMVLLLTLSFVSAIDLEFSDPTPADGSSVFENPITLNVSATNVVSPSYTLYNDGLVAWYRFDNDAGVGEESGSIFDWSGNDKWAMSVNGPSPSDGYLVGGYSLDGNDQYVISQDLSSKSHQK